MDQGHRESADRLAKLQARLAREYRQAYDDVKIKTDNYFKKFYEQDKERRKMLSDNKITKKEYEDWRARKMMVGKRWSDYLQTVTEDMTHTNIMAAQIINGEMPDIYALNYNFGTFEVEHGTRIDTSFTLVDRDTVANLMRDDPEILPQAGVNIEKDKAWNRRHVHSAITQGILQGEPIPDIAKRLIPVTGMNKSAAIRNARTLTTAAENRGRVDSYRRAKNMGIEVGQEWMATLDSRTRASHRHLDGEVIDVGGVFSNGCRYPGDPLAPMSETQNCRCTLVAKLLEYDFKDEVRNSKLGEMTYDEWKEGKDLRRAKNER